MTEPREATPKNVHLACGCWVIYFPPPMTDDVLYCRKCQDYFRVIGGQINNLGYTIHCLGCEHERRYNAALRDVDTLATAHAIKKQHSVQILNGNGTVRYQIDP